MIPAAMTEKYKGRIINIHPSLIPSFCGVGYYGLKVHEAAPGQRREGDRGYGPLCGRGHGYRPHYPQKAVEVEEGDTPEILQRRVMEQAEWVILPKAINMIANGQ